ncbi:MAG: RNA 2'-phosphotransferase [Planctomycetes bacterium]|nr:RNA 2'-phosphotransferase [Planctomycetota bacterium]
MTNLFDLEPSNLSRRNSTLPPILAEIVAAWQTLPKGLQTTMLRLVEFHRQPVTTINQKRKQDVRSQDLAAAAELCDVHRKLLRALRHAPQEFNLDMDENGWVCLDQIYAWFDLTLPEMRNVGIKRIIAGHGPRFAIKGNYIRATYGHSCIQYSPQIASIPKVPLFHGTTGDVLPLIDMFGLTPGYRRFVQLTTDFRYAAEIGRNRGSQPVVLCIDIQKANQLGIRFFESGTHVWCSTAIPANCLSTWQASEADPFDAGLAFDDDFDTSDLNQLVSQKRNHGA